MKLTVNANSIIDSLIPMLDEIQERYEKIPRGSFIDNNSEYRRIYDKADQAERAFSFASDILGVNQYAIYSAVLVARRWYMIMKNCSCNVLEATNITVVPGTSMTITVIPTQQFKDYKGYELCLPQALPPRTGTEEVFIFDGVNTYYATDYAGNKVRSGRLRGHSRYRLIYGSDGEVAPFIHFVFACGLKCMEYSANPALFGVAAPEIFAASTEPTDTKTTISKGA